MSANQSPFVLGDKDAYEIKLFCDVAKTNGATLTLREIIRLTAIGASEQELEAAWGGHAELSSAYELRAGMVVEKKEGVPTVGNDIVFREVERRMRARRYLRPAGKFSLLCRGDHMKLVSVSGSVSYRSVSEKDDLDFFLVTRKDRMWISLTKSLLLARYFQRTTSDCPPICLSCTMDEDFARREFTAPKDALFARDALNAFVLHGGKYYLELIATASWMSLYYPILYASKGAVGAESRTTVKQGSSIAVTALNSFLYFTVGTYIKVKAWLLNRRLQRDGRYESMFRVLSGRDHCVYESTRYVRLRKLYSGIGEKGRIGVAATQT